MTTAIAGAWVLAAALAGAAFAVGTVHTATLCVVTVFLAVATGLVWWNAEPANMRLPATVLVVTGAALTTYTALQCVPIPLAWMARIAPRNADVWARSLLPLHEAAPRWATLSIDPTATRVEVLKGVAYLLAFLTALRIARRRRGVGFLAAALVVTGIALAIAALLHPAFGAAKLYGVWTPEADYGRHLAPFLNPNNLASYLNIALCLALSGALAQEPRVPRPILAAVVIVLAATQIWVASRGGVVGMVLGIVLVFAISRAGRMRRHQTLASVSLMAGVAVAAGAFMVVLGGSEDASSELLVSDTSKLGMFAQAMRMAPAYPLFGVGRGAFETAFPAFRHALGYQTNVYPENVVAQWLLEWGVPFGLAGLGGVAVGLRPNAALARSSTAAGAWAAVVSVAVQNLVDLGTEIPGLMLAVVVCGAMVVGGSAGHTPRWSVEKWAKAPRAVAALSCAAAVFAVLGAFVGMHGEVDGDRQRLSAAAGDPGVSRDAMRALARAAMTRHPGEPYLTFVTASRALSRHDDDPMPWLEATLERSPVYGPAHLLIARLVAPRSRSQARLEYRRAMEQAPDAVTSMAMTEAPHIVGGFDDAMELVPDGSVGRVVLRVLVESLETRLPSTCVRLDAELSARFPTAVEPALREARRAAEDTDDPETPWCDAVGRRACIQRALETAKRARGLAPKTCEPYALHARALAKSGDAVSAFKELAEAADAVDDRVACLQTVVILATQLVDPLRAAEAMDRIANAGCANDAECAANLTWVGAFEESHGRAPRALALYRRAYDRTPDKDALLETIARLAASMNLHAEAAENFGRLARRHPAEVRFRKAADDERLAAARAATGL